MEPGVQAATGVFDDLVVVYTTFRESGTHVVGELEGAVEDAYRLARARGVVVLATCNRFEVYMDDPEAGAVEAVKRLIRSKGGTPLEAKGKEAARRILRIASGLDSAILGEPEILGQVRSAWRKARERGASSSLLDSVFHAAIITGKRVRRETGISRGNASYPSAAVQLAARIRGGLDGARVLVVGAGKASAGVLRVLCTTFVPAFVAVASRDRGRAVDLLERAACKEAKAVGLGDASRERFDVAFVAVKGYRVDWVLHAAEVVVDLSTPPAVPAVEGRVFTMKDLEEEVQRVIEERRRHVPRAEEIVEEELEKLASKLRQRAVSGLLQAIEAYVDAVARNLAGAGADAEERYELLMACARKILHPLYVGLRKSASTAWTLGDLIQVLEDEYRRRVTRFDGGAPKLPRVEAEEA